MGEKMSKLYQKLWLIACLGLVLTGCAGPKIEWDYNPSVNMTQWHTYAWLPPAGKPSVYPVDSLLNQRIRSAVDKVLQAKGLKKDKPANADVLVNASAQTRTRRIQDQVVTSMGYGFSPWGVGIRTENHTYDYDVSILRIDIINPGNHSLLWQGKATSRMLDKGSPQARKKAVDSAVTAILAPYPYGQPIK